MSLVSSIEVEGPPEDVFAYATDPTRFVEWQKNVVGGHMEQDDPLALGRSRHRRTIRATVNVTVEPLEPETRSLLTVELDFEGHGIVRRQARTEMPTHLEALKRRLEGA
jgi:hypothetical protein